MAASKSTNLAAVEGDDFDTLYALIKGARHASGVMDAKTCFEQHDFSKAVKELVAVQERHLLGHTQTVKAIADLESSKAPDAPDRARRLKKKCEQNENAFAQLDLMLSRLKRAAARQERQQSVQDSTSEDSKLVSTPVEPTALPPEFASKFESAKDTETQVKVVCEFFDLFNVAEEGDIREKSLYCFQGGDRQLNVILTGADPITENVSLQLAISGKSLKAVPLEKFVQWGVKGKLARLVAKTVDPLNPSESDESGAGDVSTSSGSSSASLASEGYTDDARDKILDMGAFSQLVDAAQRSGIVANCDGIAHIRDREFRTGDFAEAFQRMEGHFGKFNAAASQRDQRLRREDMEIKSGRVKMSPKDIQAKRAKDAAETQQIARARSRFMRVMEGLRVLMRLDGDEGDDD